MLERVVVALVGADHRRPGIDRLLCPPGQGDRGGLQGARDHGRYLRAQRRAGGGQAQAEVK